MGSGGWGLGGRVMEGGGVMVGELLRLLSNVELYYFRTRSVFTRWWSEALSHARLMLALSSHWIGRARNFAQTS